MNRREKTYRNKVAGLATPVCNRKLEFFSFLDEIEGEDDPYKTGDDEVDELIDLLEHEPRCDGLFGVTRAAHETYMKRIWELISNLKK